MKVKRNLLILLVCSVLLMVGTGCRVQHQTYHKKGMIISTKPSGKMPPGQMKKAYGVKSAKAFAPGQNKKSKAYSPKHSKKIKGPLVKHSKKPKKRK